MQLLYIHEYTEGWRGGFLLWSTVSITMKYTQRAAHKHTLISPRRTQQPILLLFFIIIIIFHNYNLMGIQIQTLLLPP